MRFRSSRETAPPQIDLIPMLTVMMGVLAFFVVATTTLGNEGAIDMQLPAPQPEEPSPQPTTSAPFLVEMDVNGGLMLNRHPIDRESLKNQMVVHLDQQSDHVVYFLPDQDLTYEQVMDFLGEMRALGGNRVSLVIEE
jgi:biopolymer transport protein ExbD